MIEHFYYMKIIKTEKYSQILMQKNNRNLYKYLNI